MPEPHYLCYDRPKSQNQEAGKVIAVDERAGNALGRRPGWMHVEPKEAAVRSEVLDNSKHRHHAGAYGQPAQETVDVDDVPDSPDNYGEQEPIGHDHGE